MRQSWTPKKPRSEIRSMGASTWTAEKLTPALHVRRSLLPSCFPHFSFLVKCAGAIHDSVPGVQRPPGYRAANTSVSGNEPGSPVTSGHRDNEPSPAKPDSKNAFSGFPVSCCCLIPPFGFERPGMPVQRSHVRSSARLGAQLRRRHFRLAKADELA